MPAAKIKKSIFEELTALFDKYKGHQDAIDLRDNWLPEMLRHTKLIKCLNFILDKNLKASESFVEQEFLKDIDTETGKGALMCEEAKEEEKDEQSQSQSLQKVSYISVRNQKKIAKILHKIEKKLKSTFEIPDELLNQVEGKEVQNDD